MSRVILPVFLIIFLLSCNNQRSPRVTDLADTPEELKARTSKDIREAISFIAVNKGRLDSSLVVHNPERVQWLYEQAGFEANWLQGNSWSQAGDSLLYFISRARLYALFPEDYHWLPLQALDNKFRQDSLIKGARKDAALWARADLLLTDALVQLVTDLKLGRLPADSITLRKDSVLSNEFYAEQLRLLKQEASPFSLAFKLEPGHQGYHLLKAGLKNFLDSADDRVFTRVPLPVKGGDQQAFYRILQQRLFEEGLLADSNLPLDSAQLAAIVKQYQQKKGLAADGKPGEGTVRMLNLTDRERFVRIAIVADRYKLLPEKMPDRYLWVNLPSFYLRLFEKDTVHLLSRIICGRPGTRTPVLTSAISEMITYPQWTVPQSIIAKEMLPAIKKDPGYLQRKGYSLVDSQGDEVDPYTVEWSKYSKGIPYRIVQGSGDANALGILKFNFSNKYAVYLHDTNQRYLFGQSSRSLSHGCVRVQNWEGLMYDILQEDSIAAATPKMYTPVDSVRSWLARKEKKVIIVRNRLPVYIRYFTCEGKDGRILFYDDIYGEDRRLADRYFAGK